MTRRAFTFAPVPHGAHWIIESPDGGGTVLARKPRGPSVLDPVPPRLFATEAAALLYMQQKGMQRTASMTRWDAAAHRAAELDLLSAVSVALQTATEEPMPARPAPDYAARVEAYAKRAGMLQVRTPFGFLRVLKNRARLERFARDVRNGGGFRPSKPHAIGRDRETWQAFQPATAEDARRFGCYSNDELVAMCAERKAYALKIMRQRWQGADCGPSVRLDLAWDIEVVQREMVRRGLLDATDHDKVNAAPVQEDVPECERIAPAAPAPASAEDAAQDAILAALNTCLDEAACKYPQLGRLNPAARFDMRGRALGMAVAKRNKDGTHDYAVRFNLRTYGDRLDYLLQSTVPHEVAHLVAHALGFGFHHNAQWREICVALGGNGHRLACLTGTRATLTSAPASLPAPAAPAPAPRARKLRVVPPPAPAAPAPAATGPETVEFVEAIETTDGRLVMAVFDDDIELLGLFEGFESRIRAPQTLREALAAPAAGACGDWPAACSDAQGTYDRLTEHRWDYNVIGRWSRSEGLDLTELKLSRLLGRGPRAILGPPLAA